jgi:hypothetical protein
MAERDERTTSGRQIDYVSVQPPERRGQVSQASSVLIFSVPTAGVPDARDA